MPRDGSKNLIPPRSKEEAQERGKKGGVASGEARRKKRDTAKIANQLLSMKVKSNDIKNDLKHVGIDVDSNTTMETAVIAGLLRRATFGNVMAIEKLYELCGDSTTDAEEYPPVKIPAELLGKAYVDINRHISNGIVKEAILKGGRGSLKSSYPGLKIPELIMANPSMHALCLRNVKDTLRDSVYEQIKWGIEKLGVSDRWKFTTSPLQITYLPTSQRIYFRGCDDPLKIKSLKPPFGYVGILWVEEFAEISGGEAAIRNIRQSAIRGTDESGQSRSIIFETFNPPPTASAWANKYVADILARVGTENEKKGTEILHTNYTDAPREWLGDEFIAEAEDLKRVNPRAYANEYLGEVTGTGGNVFENLEIRPITDEEIESFDKVKQGLDWGYLDPTAFVRLQYEPRTMTVYIFDEIRRVKTGNEELGSILEKYKSTWTIADSAEPKSIDDFIKYGFKIRGALKSHGSVAYGTKWLASRAKIVIDRQRCPETAKEFEAYEYEKDRDGNYIDSYVDRDNHSIDAVRYALNDEIEHSHAAVKKVRY